MGFNLNKARQAKESILKSFTPMNLDEGNVEAIFNRCLATNSTTEYIKSVLYQKEFGYEQDSNPILFDKGKLLANLKHIRYLYGQLKTAHEHSNTISTDEDNVDRVVLNYLNNTWTTNKGIILQFFHLGVGSGTIYPFSLFKNSGFQTSIQPVLSPKDPNFVSWWEAHKSEWE